MHFQDDVIAFIGPACAFALEPVARLAAYWNTPIITGMGDQVSGLARWYSALMRRAAQHGGSGEKSRGVGFCSRVSGGAARRFQLCDP